jgi:hypothetical protein
MGDAVAFSSPAAPERRAAMYNVVVVSLAFAVLFSAYNPLQNVATSLFPPGLGDESLGVLYGSVALFVFAGPPIVDALGTKVTMIVGAVGYVAYMLSLIHIIPGVVLFMSTIIGFGAAILWIAEGEFIKENSTAETRGIANGIFWCLFQLNQICGNLVTYLVFPHLSSTSMLYVGFSVVGAVGTAMLFLLRKSAYPGNAVASGADDDDGGASSKRAARSWSQRMSEARASAYAAFRLAFTTDSLLMSSMYAFTGIELSFWTGEFTQLLNSDVIGLVLTCAGVGEVIGGLLFGRLSDVAGRSLSVCCGTALYGLGMGLACWMKLRGGQQPPMLEDAPLIAYFAALCFGLADSAFNTNVFAMVSQLYADAEPKQPSNGSGSGEGEDALLIDSDGGSDGGDAAAGAAGEEAPTSVSGFTVFQLMQNLGSCVWYFIAYNLPMHDPATGPKGTFAQIWIQTALLAVATVTFIVVDRRTRRR